MKNLLCTNKEYLDHIFFLAEEVKFPKRPALSLACRYLNLAEVKIEQRNIDLMSLVTLNPFAGYYKYVINIH